jgi:tetratricopeptide (TPR) repeat protein
VAQPGFVVVGTTPDAGTAAGQAVPRHAAGGLPEATARDRAADSADPTDAAALTELGILRSQQNNPHESAALLRRATLQQPDLAKAHAYLGAALQNLGSHEEALASLDRALRLAPDFTDSMRRWAHSLQALGRSAEAIAGYETLLAIEQRNGSVLPRYRLKTRRNRTKSSRRGHTAILLRRRQRMRCTV